MRYETIADIYSANEKFGKMLASTVAGISPEEATALPKGEKWSIQQIVEHVSMVDFGISRICAKLLEAAKVNGKPSDGRFALSPNFGERAAEIAVTKVEAPERVQPAGDVSIAESLDRMKASGEALASLRSDFECFDLSGPTFPHPFFGEMNAGEWLVMAGLHKNRHNMQIETLAAKIRQ